MIVSIMHPYFFPYIGYFQLIFQSDIFVLSDDAQYINLGWVNRNRILRNGEPCWFTFPVRKGSSHLKINQRSYLLDRATIGRLLRRLEAAYRKAPHFEAIFPVVEELLSFGDANVAAFNINLIERIAARLGIATRFVLSSTMANDNSLAGQERVIDMCRRLGATHYVNPVGGLRLYTAERFAAAGMTLSFLKAGLSAYPQFEHSPVPGLSIIDVLMFNSDEAVARLLRDYRLQPGGDVVLKGAADEQNPGTGRPSAVDRA
jgi:WbqC-like protein family